MKKVILITGVSGNMGRAVADKFLQEGCQVIGTIVPNDPVPLDINDANFEKKQIDLSDEQAAKEMVFALVEAHRRIDVAVLTVGGFAMGGLADTSAQDVMKQVALNFETAYHVARPVFLQMMKQKSGRIFLVGSRPGLNAKSGKGMVAYSLAKSMIFRLAELVNDEAKGTDVVCSVLVPSTIDTPQNRKSMPAADFSSWVKPATIADCVSFYCSQQAGAIREPVIKLYNNS